MALSPIMGRWEFQMKNFYFTKENKMSQCRKPVATDRPVREKKAF